MDPGWARVYINVDPRVIAFCIARSIFGRPGTLMGTGLMPKRFFFFSVHSIGLLRGIWYWGRPSPLCHRACTACSPRITGHCTLSLNSLPGETAFLDLIFRLLRTSFFGAEGGQGGGAQGGGAQGGPMAHSFDHPSALFALCCDLRECESGMKRFGDSRRKDTTSGMA